ncbi:hypothetical protein PAHAL_9G513000 [Panicum hallii]|uniref:Uncharacterized protein n=1 Tax=Panicum hallii TaxID=206008 RepID=A0A2S3IRW8_9POAL|nr:hypothetical protein PAHAL_9G513000 [Panicum hallii]
MQAEVGREGRLPRAPKGTVRSVLEFPIFVIPSACPLDYPLFFGAIGVMDRVSWWRAGNVLMCWPRWRAGNVPPSIRLYIYIVRISISQSHRRQFQQISV